MRRAQDRLPGAAIVPADDVVAMSALVVLAVPDDVLPELVVGLAATGAWRPGQFVVHTSGAHGLGVLAPAAAAGALVLALHPAMTFTGRDEDIARLDGAPFGVTAEAGLRPVAEALVVEMGGEPFWVGESARTAYHAALSLGSNHLVTLVSDALDLLGAAGVEEPARVLAPLLGAALDNTLRLGDGALTGPVSRGDAHTVAGHLRAIDDLVPPLRPPYIAMAARTAVRAEAAGRITATQAAAVRAVLQEEPGD
ncbi:MAG: uncharacterized protein JWN61_1629 [Pseudonocardiales bacterium]|nr:uncharacterized protein [Pseudonocardiales bacterium]